MKSILRITISIFLLLCFTTASAQGVKSKLRKANKAFELYDYQGAIEMYLEILDKSDVSEAKINLAESYRKVSNSVEAEYWYGQVVRLPEATPLHKLYYGMALQTNGKCELALKWFREFSDAVPDDERGKHLSKNCEETIQKELRSKYATLFEVIHMDFNTSTDDFCPVFYKDGLVFASEQNTNVVRQTTHTWTGYPFLELFYVERSTVNEENLEYSYGTADKYNKELQTRFHDGPICFSKDQSEVYFTRNNIYQGKVGKDDEGIIRLKIFHATLNGDKWENIEGMPFNSDEYSVAHPALTPDGTRLYFSSDMPGGFGGMDLYVSNIENGRLSPPINLGPSINTEGHEVFPYFYQLENEEEGTLYFASDGHTGLGGLDLFYALEIDDSSWGSVTNIGLPLNSESDDFGMIFNKDGNFGYFTSDREGGNGRDDIYAFKKLTAKLEILVYDKNSGLPIDSAEVKSECLGSLPLYTNKDGKVSVELPLETCCDFLASKQSYIDNNQEACTKGYQAGSKLIAKIPLDRPMEFDLVGTVTDQITGRILPGTVLTLTNDCNDPSQTAIADQAGKYKFKLRGDCCYVIKAENSGSYLVNTLDQCTRGLTQTTTLPGNIALTPFSISSPAAPSDPFASTNKLVPNNAVYNPTSGMYETPDGNKYKDPPGSPVTSADIIINGSNSIVIDTSFPKDSDSRTFLGNSSCCGPMYAVWNDKTGQIDIIFEIEHIYYDFDQSYIRDDANESLDKVLALLNSNPDLIIEIASHTDSRGSFRYNERLSQRRAEAVVRWLIDRGVAQERLQAQGYGENVHVNGCDDDVPCSEEEHQRNRRSEFRVVGRLSDGRSMSTNSIAPANIRIDPCEGCPF